MPKYTIGIDYGSLSGRAVLVDVSNGRALAECAMDYPHAVISDRLPATGEALPPDWALQDPHDYLDVLEYIIPEVIRRAAVDPCDIIGAGIDFTCCTLLPVFADGTPLCFDDQYKNNPHAYVKLWKHHAAQKYADLITAAAERLDAARLARFGGKISSEWTFPKIWQTLDEAPDVYFDTSHFIEAGDWLAWQLTGERSRGYCFASYKSMYIEEMGGYPSEEFFAALDPSLRSVVADKLSGKLLKCGECAGYVTSEAAARFGLPAGIAISASMPDAHTAAISLGLLSDGDMCAIMGTSSCYMLICDKLYDVGGICGTVRDGLTPDFFGYEAGLCCVGDHFAWVKDNCMTAEYLAEAKERGIPPLKLLIEKAAAQAPGEHGLLALNWFNGNRNILVDASLSGTILGLTLASRPEDILRALIEATAFGTRVIIENFRSHGAPVKRLIAAGGIARKDPFTMQLYADILGMDIEIAETTQAPALSGAIQAAAAAEAYPSIAEATRAMSVKCDKIYHPNPDAGAVYDKLYSQYLALYDYFGRGGNDVMKTLKAISAEAKNK